MRRFLFDVFVAGLLLFLIRTIVGVELEEAWNQTVQPYIAVHFTEWVIALFSLLPTFWGGAFAVLFLLSFADIIYWMLRTWLGPSVPDVPSTDGISAIGPYGDSVVATGQLWTPPPWEPKSFYVGTMIVSDDGVDAKRQIELSIRSYNGAGRKPFIQRVKGHISFTAPDGSKTVLPSPWISNHSSDVLAGREEFHVVLEQSVSAELIELLASLNNNVVCHLDLTELDIMVADKLAPENAIRLPIWDGIRLHRDPRRLLSGRMIFVTANTGVYSTRSV